MEAATSGEPAADDCITWHMQAASSGELAADDCSLTLLAGWSSERYERWGAGGIEHEVHRDLASRGDWEIGLRRRIACLSSALPRRKLFTRARGSV